MNEKGVQELLKSMAPKGQRNEKAKKGNRGWTESPKKLRAKSRTAKNKVYKAAKSALKWVTKESNE